MYTAPMTRTAISAVAVVILITLGVLSAAYMLGDTVAVFGDRARLEQLVRTYGVFGPIVISALVLIESLIAPLPGGVLPVLAGALYGIPGGVLASWIGNFLAAIIAFAIARIWGERVVRFFMPSFSKEHYSEFVKKNQWFFWATFAFPTAPSDVLSFALGTSTMGWNHYTIGVGASLLLRMVILVSFGESLADLLFI